LNQKKFGISKSAIVVAVVAVKITESAFLNDMVFSLTVKKNMMNPTKNISWIEKKSTFFLTVFKKAVLLH